MTSSPREVLEKLSETNSLDIQSYDFAEFMDKNDPLASFRNLFQFPERINYSDNVKGFISDNCGNENKMIYFSGHSLGLKPIQVDGYISNVLDNWSKRAVESHFGGYLPAAFCENYCKDIMATLVGAQSDDIAIMNALTVNIHILMTAFYRPAGKRRKILIEDHAFPSDRYAAVSQIELHGFDPKEDLLIAKTRTNEHCLRLDDTLKIINEKGNEIALILWPGVQYYTGQLFDMEAIIHAAHSKGCKIGLDLAHAVGNVALELDKWNPDFAVWCTYKYLNAGAGSIGAAFVNSKHTKDESDIPFLKGWWGNNTESKFAMRDEFEPCIGADRFKLSNQSPVLCAMLMCSLEIFEKATLGELIHKQFLLTGYLEYLLKTKLPEVDILTPSDVTQRGNQLSLFFNKGNIKEIQVQLQKLGVMCDVREPSVARLAPVPLYNSFQDVFKLVDILTSISNDTDILRLTKNTL